MTVCEAMHAMWCRKAPERIPTCAPRRAKASELVPCLLRSGERRLLRTQSRAWEGAAGRADQRAARWEPTQHSCVPPRTPVHRLRRDRHRRTRIRSPWRKAWRCVYLCKRRTYVETSPTRDLEMW